MASKGNATFSVIGTDVTITGDIAASADLHVDGTIAGDIRCSSIVQGEESVIEGGVEAETARLAGTVKGSIKARELTVLRSARIHGDVQYDSLTIEQGAQVDGRFAHGASAVKAAAQQPGGAEKAAPQSDPQLQIAG